MKPRRAQQFGDPTLDQAINKKPPELLYHYTDQRGFMGIVEKKEIWATHHQYLNDSKEYVQAFELIKAELQNRLAAVSGPKAELESTLMAFDSFGKLYANQYVASFSEAGDSLSQWRAYGGTASGFALGFDFSSFDLQERFNLMCCVCKRDEQLALVEALISKAIGNAERLRLGLERQ